MLILGATSSIAQEVARLYAAERASLLLVGHREEMLRSIARELTVCGAAEVGIAVVDFIAEERPADRFSEFVRRLGWIDHILLAYGLLGDQANANRPIVMQPLLASRVPRLNDLARRPCRRTADMF